MTAYYNENDPYAAQWLRNLIEAGEIAPGYVDDRSIVDVRPDELDGYTQCHFFAGIGVWSYALRRAGWPDDTPVWTGSCPCQPFSAAGKGEGFADERHLWPAFHYLVEQCQPPVVFGEQVASKDGLEWLDLVQADLEATGYASEAVDLCAPGVGGPHIRQRIWWVAERGVGLADAYDAGLEGRSRAGERAAELAAGAGGMAGRVADAALGGGWALNRQPGSRVRQQESAGGRDISGGLEHLASNGRHERRPEPSGRGVADGCSIGGVADANRGQLGGLAELRGAERDRQGARWPESGCGAPACGDTDGLADADGRDASAERVQRGGQHGQQPQDGGVVRPGDSRIGHNNGPELDRPRPTDGFWRDADWLFCRDGKWRPVEPGTFPLAHGLARGMGTLQPELRRLAEVAGLDGKSLARAKAHRIGSLKGYGNAIVPEAAAEVIAAFMDVYGVPSLERGVAA